MAKVKQAQIRDTRIELVEGDITKQEVEAIVNAANESLLGGGGVDGAIHRAAGPQLLEETRKIGGCPTGQARISGGYQLPADYVIHAVGPVYGTEGAAELLASAHEYSLKLADEHDIKTIAFPAISTGIYGYPLEEAAPVALNAVCDYIKTHQPEFELVRFVLFSSAAMDAFSIALGDLTQNRSDVKPV